MGRGTRGAIQQKKKAGQEMKRFDVWEQRFPRQVGEVEVAGEMLPEWAGNFCWRGALWAADEAEAIREAVRAGLARAPVVSVAREQPVIGFHGSVSRETLARVRQREHAQ
jgi:hypothetical protein